MAKTLSKMIELGTLAPQFSLLDVQTHQNLSLNSHKGSVGTLIMFICNHCPYVKHVAPELTRLAMDYMHLGISMIAINSNDATQYPDDSPDRMVEEAKHYGYPFPYLIDETQEVAHAYQAACTPDFYLFDNQLSLVYRGQLDDSRPGNSIELTGRSIRHALDCLIQNKPNTDPQLPSMGCNIKWK